MTVTRPARTMTAPPLGNTSTSVKAKHADNQGALDRLQEMLERAAQSNFKFTLKRAINAVRDCKHPIVTIEQAMELKYVGDRLSRIIVPNAARSAPLPAAAKKKPPPPPPASVATLSTTTEPSRKRKSKQTTLTSSGSIVVPSSETAAASEETSVKPSAKEKAFETAKKQAEELVLPSGPWKVILLVDIREHRSKNVVAKCQQSGIPCEERSLPIGDMAWIAQCQTPTTVVEVLLGTILERKEVNDLASSIHGTRFLEQRLRLYHCGLPQILYLVEGDLNTVQNCPAETLRMAMMETRVQLGFSVLQTKHLQDTVQTLKGLHRRLVQRTFPDAFDELPIFAGRGSGPQDRRKKRRRPSSLLELVFDTPPVPPFGRSRFTTYAELKAKVERDREAGTKTVGAIYMAMLKQVTSLSQKKCQAIATEYPTWSHLLTAYDGVCESSQASSSAAALVGGDDSVKQPPTALLVKDVLSGQQKVGPKSAVELDIVCCVERDGTLMKLREGGAIGPPPTKKAATALESTRTTAAAVATTAARTVSDSSNSSTGTAYRGTSAGSSSTGAPTHSSTSTRIAAAAAHSQGAAASSCLDLTMDSPAPKEQAATGRTTTFASAYEPIWSEEHDSSSEDEALASRAPTFSSSGDGGGNGKNNKLTNVSHRDKGQVTLAIDIDSDDDDDDSREDITLDMATNLATSNVARMPLFATMLSSTATTNGTLAESGPPRNVASRKPRRDSESDTTFCFSSPSTTNSGLALSQDSTSSEKKGAKAARALKNTTNQRQQQADQSIVVIDSSDDEENCGIAVAKAPSSAATALLQSSQNSSASGEPPDLRSRLAKHLGRETIEIDI